MRAIHEKHVHFIKWRRGMFEKFNDQTRRTLCWEAAREGSVEILTFLLEECRWNTVFDDYGDLYRAAIFYNPDVDHQPILSYLYEKGHGFDSRATVAAAFVGNLDTLEWLRARGCPWNSGVVENAAEKGHLHILEYALDHGCDGGAWVFCYAARGGHIHVMEWAMARGLEWDERTSSRPRNADISTRSSGSEREDVRGIDGPGSTPRGAVTPSCCSGPSTTERRRRDERVIWSETLSLERP